METSPRQYPHSPAPRRRRKRRRRSPLPAALLLLLLAAGIAAGVLACNRREDPPEPPQGQQGALSREESGSDGGQGLSESCAVDPSGAPEGESAPEPGRPATSSSAPEGSAPPADDNPSSGDPAGGGELEDDWRLVLVNPTHKLDGDYDVQLAPVQGSYQMDARMAEDMKAMLAAAKADGYSLQVYSAYRSTERSRVLYEGKVAEFRNAGYDEQTAAVEAAKWIAPPGTSEHNTGLAADIVSGDYFTKYADLEHEFDTFEEFEWLYSHCAEYGFILRYPKDKQEITGITYEPWHYRYVGREHARQMMEQKICLEEYLGES